MNSAVFGIHIGNTNSLIAVCKSKSQVETLVDEAGDRVVPSIVTITEEEPLLGYAAKSAMASKWKTTITSNKSLLSIDQTDIDFDSHHNIPLTFKNNEIHYCITLEEKVKHLTRESITEMILKKLHNTAKNSMNMNEENLSCVLLVPEHFSEDACTKYKHAAESVGWVVLQIIHETAAAVLAYSLLEHIEPPQTVLVYRLGGTSCEVGCYDLIDGMMYSLGTEFSNSIGGHCFTKILTEYLAGEFYNKYKLDIRENRRSSEKLKLASEKCVHTLSKGPTAHCFVESLHDGVDFSMVVSRARFELLIEPIMTGYLKPLKVLLNKLCLEDSVNKVVLCGGAASVPKLHNCIAKLFDSSVTEILSHINSDEVLALGAAKQGYYLTDNRVKELLPRTLQIPVSVPAKD